MANSSSVTIKEYYKSFRSLYGVLAAVFCFLPAASNFVVPGRVFPPLGEETIVAQFFVVLLGVAISFVMFLMKSAPVIRIRRSILLLLLMAVFFCCAYFWLHLRFVRRIEIPSVSASEIVSVGYERTPFANATFPAASDAEMLYSRGVTEEEIARLYTAKSLSVARLALFSSFAGVVLSLVALASLGVLLHVRQA